MGPPYTTEEGAYFRSLQRTDHGREDMSHYAHDLKLFRGCGQSFLNRFIVQVGFQN